MAATAAVAIGRSLLTFRSSSPSYYLIISKRLFSSLSSIARSPPLPGFSRPVRSCLSRSLRVVAPGMVRLNPIRCRVNLSGDAYSPLISCSNFSKQHMIDCHVQTLAKVLGCEEEAKKIYNVSCERYFGFGCDIDEETSNKLEGLPGVLFVLPDSYVDAENKDYGAELYVNGERVHGSPENQRRVEPVPQPRYNARTRSCFMPKPSPLPCFSSPSVSSLFKLTPPLFHGHDVSVRFYSSGVVIQRMKYPKYRKGRIEGIRDGGNEICFGKYALQALEPARITSKQIEAGRRALQMNVRRGGKGGKVWVRVFPYKSVTSKPSEVRMGRGKGAISSWVAPVKRGQIIYEMGGVTESLAKRAIQIAGSKMPIQTRSIIRDAKTKEIGIR